jgi:hypothetical protein
MSDLSAFDGDAERERQILRSSGEGQDRSEVVAMLGCSVPDIHRVRRKPR